ncbi:MAG: hypothetical protein LIO51_02515 [Clostridiales bacterium]|nr:hypothetical protein [Clostridiales bacterium]
MSERETEQEAGWTLFRETGLPQAYTYWKMRQRQREAIHARHHQGHRPAGSEL